MNQQPNDSTKQRLFAALRGIGHGLTVAAGWLGDRINDFAQWIADLIRLLPARLGRLGLTLAFAVIGTAMFLPIGVRVWRRGGRSNFAAWLRVRARHGGLRTMQFMLQVLDLFGTPELFAFLWRAVTHTTPLTGDEISAAASVLGPHSLRFQDVRVAQDGVLRPIFRRNGGRAFTTFHTVNLPSTGYHERSNLPILVHELVHVYQYERVGSRYFAEALLAQHEAGYDYGGVDALQTACQQGKHLRDFNREQQAQIVQDCYTCRCSEGNSEPFEPFMAELRAGKV